MCGLTGFLDFDRSAGDDELCATAGRMADTLVLRGPDDRGVWSDAAAGVALGFRRLSIVDLSPEGHQPMASASGRFVLAFNGEVYNHVDLRRELEGPGSPPFRGHSDTEVMLAAFERWGVEGSLGRFVGMFGFALWDRRERRLHLARDRMGEKPMYYGRTGGAFLFGSELKALRAYPGFRGEVDRDALALFLRHGYYPTPHSVYRGVRKLPPGTLLTVEADRPGAEVTLRAYWSAAGAAEAGRSAPFAGTEEEAGDRLEALLRDSVRRQMVADVPLGAFLSGGVDSSTVVALMQAEGTRATKTFTIGFEDAAFDEAGFAREVARHLGTEHTELYVTPADALKVVPGLPALYDEPFADASAIPTYLVSCLARRSVTVSLSGDGGDELFGGYAWYPRTDQVWGRVRRVPRPLRRALAAALAGPAVLGAAALGRSVAPARVARAASADRLLRLAELLRRSAGPEDVHRVLLSMWGDDPRLVLGAGPRGAATDGPAPRTGLDDVARVMLHDTETYLPDDILVKVDRASMGASLEARAPFLDHRVVEFAWTLPTAYKLRAGRGKLPVRRVLYRHVPRELIERPKRGFSVPVADWLRGPLRGWAEGLLAEERIRREGFLDPAPVRAMWREHLDGRNREATLWNVLMFQAWAAA